MAGSLSSDAGLDMNLFHADEKLKIKPYVLIERLPTSNSQGILQRGYVSYEQQHLKEAFKDEDSVYTEDEEPCVEDMRYAGEWSHQGEMRDEQHRERALSSQDAARAFKNGECQEFTTCSQARAMYNSHTALTCKRRTKAGPKDLNESIEMQLHMEVDLIEKETPQANRMKDLENVSNTDNMNTQEEELLGPNPNKCKSVRHSSNLNKHKAFHLTGRPYKCDICGRTYKQQPGLSRHKKVHRVNQPYQLRAVAARKDSSDRPSNSKRNLYDQSFVQSERLNSQAVRGGADSPENSNVEFNQDSNTNVERRVSACGTRDKSLMYGKDSSTSGDLTRHKETLSLQRPGEWEVRAKLIPGDGDLDTPRGSERVQRPLRRSIWDIILDEKASSKTVPKAIKTCSKTVPKAIKTRSETVPKAIKTCSKTAPKAIKTCSKTAPKAIKTCSKTVPKAIKTCSKTVPKAIKTCSKTAPKAIKTCSKTVPKAIKTCSKTVPKAIKTRSKAAAAFAHKTPKLKNQDCQDLSSERPSVVEPQATVHGESPTEKENRTEPFWVVPVEEEDNSLSTHSKDQHTTLSDQLLHKKVIEKQETPASESRKTDVVNKTDQTKQSEAHAYAKMGKCDICNDAFAKIALYEEESPSVCDQCVASFKQKEGGEEKTTTGNACDLNRGSTSFNEACLKTKRKKRKPGLCEICGLLFFKRAELLRHKVIHSEQTSHVEDVFDQVLSHKSSKLKHEGTHSEQNDGSTSFNEACLKTKRRKRKPSLCEICGLLFFKRAELLRHKVIHSEQTSHVEDVCDQVLSHESSKLKSEGVHSSCLCDLCGKHFSKRELLRAHLKVHKALKHLCEVCGKGFSDNHGLVIHKRRHTGWKPILCDVCGMRFYSGRHLHQHKKDHRTEGPFKCPVCDKAFTHQFKLKLHKNFHVRGKPQECRFLQKGFLKRGDSESVQHERRAQGERRYKRNSSGKRCKQSETLDESDLPEKSCKRKSHHVERPKNDTCKKSCKHKSHHVERPKKDICKKSCGPSSDSEESSHENDILVESCKLKKPYKKDSCKTRRLKIQNGGSTFTTFKSFVFWETGEKINMKARSSASTGDSTRFVSESTKTEMRGDDNVGGKELCKVPVEIYVVKEAKSLEHARAHSSVEGGMSTENILGFPNISTANSEDKAEKNDKGHLQENICPEEVYEHDKQNLQEHICPEEVNEHDKQNLQEHICPKEVNEHDKQNLQENICPEEVNEHDKQNLQGNVHVGVTDAYDGVETQQDFLYEGVDIHDEGELHIDVHYERVGVEIQENIHPQEADIHERVEIQEYVDSEVVDIHDKTQFQENVHSTVADMYADGELQENVHSTVADIHAEGELQENVHSTVADIHAEGELQENVHSIVADIRADGELQENVHSIVADIHAEAELQENVHSIAADIHAEGELQENVHTIVTDILYAEGELQENVHPEEAKIHDKTQLSENVHLEEANIHDKRQLHENVHSEKAFVPNKREFKENLGSPIVGRQSKGVRFEVPDRNDKQNGGMNKKWSDDIVGTGDLEKGRDLHSREKLQECQTCKVAFASGTSVFKSSPSNCDCCDLLNTFKQSKAEILKEIQMAKDERNSKRSSTNCKEIVWEESKKGSKSNECDACGKFFSRRSHLVRHKVTVHLKLKPYMCKECGKCFLQKQHLEQHMRHHTGYSMRTYLCQVCGKTFLSGAGLYMHKRLHTGHKVYECDVCSKQFPMRANLINHTRTHTGIKPFKCDLCNKSFAQKSALTVHKRIHTGEKPFKCLVCGKGFAQSNKLNLHKKNCDMLRMREEKSRLERPYVCNVCGQTFKRSYHLTRHKKSQRGCRAFLLGKKKQKQKVNIRCHVSKRDSNQAVPEHEKLEETFCGNIGGKEFSELRVTSQDAAELRTAKKRKNKEDRKTVSSQDREIASYDRPISADGSSTRAHGKEKCNNERDLQLILCCEEAEGYDISSPVDSQQGDDLGIGSVSGSLEKSLESYFRSLPIASSGLVPEKSNFKEESLDPKTKQNVCDICGKVFSFKSELMRHRAVHLRLKNYCDGRGRRCSQNADNPYLCHVCGKSFTSSIAFASHKRLHTGHGLYTCDLCGKMFTFYGALINHMRIHTGVKPFKCDLCNKSFAQKSALTVHKRIHTGEKPFKCLVCGKGFAQSNKLNLHKKNCDMLRMREEKSQLERPYVCDVCGQTFKRSYHLTRHKKSPRGCRTLLFSG